MREGSLIYFLSATLASKADVGTTYRKSSGRNTVPNLAEAPLSSKSGEMDRVS